MSDSSRRRKAHGAAALGTDVQGYDTGVDHLVKRIRALNESGWTPKPKRKEAKALAVRLATLADFLDATGTLQLDLEELHDRPIPPLVGDDGRSRPDAMAESWHISYQGMIWRLRDLAVSARRVATELPNPRAKAALPLAALVFLHLRYRHGFQRPTLYDAGEDVRAFQRVTDAAGMPLSAERLRGALSVALRNFDPHFFPDYLAEFVK